MEHLVLVPYDPEELRAQALESDLVRELDEVECDPDADPERLATLRDHVALAEERRFRAETREPTGPAPHDGPDA